MREVINIYRKHKISVDSFVKSLINSLPKDYIGEAPSILKQYRYIQLIYGVDEEFKQKTPIVCRRESDTRQIGSNKSHYFTKLNLNEDGSISPILTSTTVQEKRVSRWCITQTICTMSLISILSICSKSSNSSSITACMISLRE